MLEARVSVGYSEGQVTPCPPAQEGMRLGTLSDHKTPARSDLSTVLEQCRHAGPLPLMSDAHV